MRTSRSAPGAGHASAGSTRGSAGALVCVRQHVFGQRQHDRPGAALQRSVEGARDVFGHAVRVVDLGDPLREAERAGAEHLAVVDFLERLAIALLARDLADEQDHRRRVLERGVHADARVGRARAAGDEADAGAPAQLALRVGHERGAAFLPACDEAHAIGVLMKAVEHREVALARHAEGSVDALLDQAFDQRVARQACSHRDALS